MAPPRRATSNEVRADGGADASDEPEWFTVDIGGVEMPGTYRVERKLAEDGARRDVAADMHLDWTMMVERE